MFYILDIFNKNTIASSLNQVDGRCKQFTYKQHYFSSTHFETPNSFLLYKVFPEEYELGPNWGLRKLESKADNSLERVTN